MSTTNGTRADRLSDPLGYTRHITAKLKEMREPQQALLGRSEVAALLGVKSENLMRNFPELPPPLQKRGIKGFAVSTGPLWPRSEIVLIRDERRKERRRGKAKA